MGLITTPTYRVEFTSVRSVRDGNHWVTSGWTNSAWRVREQRNASGKVLVSGHGAPTVENLRRYVRDLEDSTLPGGVNEHLGMTRIGGAKIVRQSNDQVVAEYRPAAFEVL